MIQVIKKDDLSHKRDALVRLGAIGCALVVSGLLLCLVGYNPFEVIAKIFEGSMLTPYRFSETINKTIPLVVLSLGIAVAFKMKFWNIGAEGQLYMGAFGASLLALNLGFLPAWLLIPMMFVFGALCGGLWALIPAALKLRFGASETLVTLMLNYIAIKFVSYLQYGPWKDPGANGLPLISAYPESATLPKVFGVHIGWIIALALVVLVHILLKYSKLGYEISVLGESESTARYAGMNVKRIVVIAVLISGGLCGIAGMLQASGIEQTLNDQLSGGLGFTAVITTWLAQLSAPIIVVVSFLFAVLLQGGAFLQSSMQIPAAIAEVMQGIIIFFVLGCEFFIRYKVVFHKKGNAKRLGDGSTPETTKEADA